MSIRITKALSPLFRELSNGELFSRALNISLKDAPALRRCQRLLIVELDEDHCLVRSWSVVDETGVHHDVPCPFPGERTITDDFAAENPKIRYSIHKGQINLVIGLGRGWYKVLVGPLSPDSSLDIHALTVWR
jgi:hypothetical protein